MVTRLEILDHAVNVLRRREPLTLDAVARECGLTKPGIVHHFRTKEVLSMQVAARILDRWEASLQAECGEGASPADRLRAYVRYGLTGSFDSGDMSLLTDARLRDQLSKLWVERLDPWFGTDIPGSPQSRAALRSARLIADAVWYNAAFGIPTLREDERESVLRIALDLIDEGMND